MASREQRKIAGAREVAEAAKSLSDLRGLSDEDVIRQHDALLSRSTVGVGVNYYLQELARRDADRQTRTMVRLTWFITILTVVNVVAVLASLFD